MPTYKSTFESTRVFPALTITLEPGETVTFDETVNVYGLELVESTPKPRKSTVVEGDAD